MEKNWTLVYTTNKSHQAELIRTVLEDNDIECVIFNKKDSSYNSFGELEIYVNIECSEKASELIKLAEL
jgi:hypothetical protein